MLASGHRCCIKYLNHVFMTLILAVITIGMVMAVSRSESAPTPSSGKTVWVVDPTVVGDDLPPIGRSLFDFLIAKKKSGQNVYDVPFPFTALMRQLETELPLSSDPQHRALKAVLIPLGRSLQRMAASPDFFTSPRIVVTTNQDAAPQSRMLLKDRLYLGYQPKADAIEVISYNEAAGRFEFQVVKDYRVGGEPKVYYANRALCLACHQNAGPIFSRQIWDETNANPRVAALLHQHHGKDFYGIAIERGVDVPNAIDNAKLRANRYAATQLLWREACGDNETVAKLCRARLFTAVLQYKLSGNQQFEHQAFEQEAAERMRINWKASWPNGLTLGNPDIPNRNPLANPAQPVTDISARFDPLVLREPLEIWSVPKGREIDHIVDDLAQFVSENDVDVLMTAMERGRSKAASQSFSTDCHVEVRQAGQSESRLDILCESPRDQSGLAIKGQLQIKANKVTHGKLDQLVLPGQGPLRGIDLSAAPIVVRDGSRFVSLALSRNFSNDPYKPRNRPVREGKGNAVHRLTLKWSANAPTLATAEVQVASDFSPVLDAISALVKQTSQTRFDGFDAAPFRRARLMPALFQQLGLPIKEACCLDSTGLPPAMKELTVQQLSVQAIPDGTRHFFKYCSSCHLTSGSSPPSFLRGDLASVESNLNRCAERIYVRLSMWTLPVNERTKSPMPPEPYLHGLGLDTSRWPDSAERLAMTTYASSLIQAHSGRIPSLDVLLAKGYEKLPACVVANSP